MTFLFKNGFYSQIVGVIGGTLTGPLIFILPPLFYTKMLQMEKRYDKLLRESTTDDLNDTELLLKTSQYGTLQSPKHETSDREIVSFIKKAWVFLHSECLLSSVVIIFGIAATFTSTVYNILDINSLNQFWSPCIRNISLSKVLLPK